MDRSEICGASRLKTLTGMEGVNLLSVFDGGTATLGKVRLKQAAVGVEVDQMGRLVVLKCADLQFTQVGMRFDCAEGAYVDGICI